MVKVKIKFRGASRFNFSGSEFEMFFMNVYQVFVDKTSEASKHVFNLNL